MGRQWRIEFPGAMYHVMTRGNEGKNIFMDDGDRKRFIALLSDMTKRFRIEIHSTLRSKHKSEWQTPQSVLLRLTNHSFQ